MSYPSSYVQANVFNLREKKVIRDLNPEDIEQLVSVSGMVTRCSNIIPEIRSTHCPTKTSENPLSAVNWSLFQNSVRHPPQQLSRQPCEHAPSRQ